MDAWLGTGPLETRWPSRIGTWPEMYRRLPVKVGVSGVCGNSGDSEGVKAGSPGFRVDFWLKNAGVTSKVVKILLFYGKIAT